MDKYQLLHTYENRKHLRELVENQNSSRMSIFFVLVMTSTIFIGVAAQDLFKDPCDPANHVEIDEPKRSTGYVTGPPETPLCDIDLEYGWYRFTSAAGGMLATSCPKKYQCGTHVPLWMKGGHPTVEDGVVSRKVCGNYVSSAPNRWDPCCDESIPIAVKNCGRFIVYRLSSTPGCPVSFCAGDGAVCPAGKWSPTMFPPCRDQYPAITESPILHGPNVIGNTFNFECEINYEPQDPDQVFEVTWLFDGEEDTDIAPQNITDPSRVATLDGSKLAGHMLTELQCKVRAFFTGNEERASNYLYSSTYFLGIQVYPARFELSEEESFKHVIVNSTLPFLCEDDSTGCCLILKLDTDADNGNDVLVGHTCNFQLCQENSTADFPVVEVPVVARQDMISDGDKQLLLTFEPLRPTLLGPYMDIFFKNKLQQVQVVVKDEVTYTCSMTGDPHIAGFDYRTYHLYLVGDFIAYDVPEELFQVQIRTWPCYGGGVTCICGVAIREKNDIIRINMCDQAYKGPTTSPIVDAAYELREGTIVQRSEDGHNIGVYLPSGVEIRVTSTGALLNLYVTGPGTHKNKAKGICGTNDGSKDNEFTYPYGKIDPICSESWNCMPNNFFRSWRVPADDSLFMTVPDRVDVDDEEVEYCTCDKDEKIVTCEHRVNKEGTRTACPGCKDSKPVKRVENPGNRKKRDVTYEDMDEPDSLYQPISRQEVDPNKQWSINSGMTEDQATGLCTKALERSQLYSECSDKDMAQSYMTDCMADILYSGSTDFLEAVTSAFTADCQLTLAKDPANYVSNLDGQSVMKVEFLEYICDQACYENGQCGEGGVCLCDKGWEGANCQIQSGIGPQLLNIRSGPLCDVAQRPCQKVFMDVTNIKLSESLVCRLQPVVNASGAEIGPPVETEAEFVSAYRISCHRSQTTSSSQHYRISASNDGDLFGNALPLHVFDSTCLDCTLEGCSEKATACHIDGVCYSDGAEHPESANNVCDVSKNTTAWTFKPRGNAGTTVGPCMWKLLIPFIGLLSVCSYF